MKRLVAASIGVLAIGLTTASAADLRARPVYRAPPPAPAPAPFRWTDRSFGGHVGGVWTRKEWVVRDPAFSSFGQSDGSHNADGFLGGVQGGCDYQFAGGFVIGVAGDYSWTDADGSHVSPLFPGFINHTKVDSLASVTGRIGYAWDRFLGYVKGGGAWERDKYDFSNGVLIGTLDDTRSGWTVGIGGEYAFTNFVTGFIEYDYYDFNNRDLTFVQNNGRTFVYGIDETKHVLKAGLNFRFGGWIGPAGY
jgi:outer membrane immunogenic protein